jgi:hypothetical protein
MRTYAKGLVLAAAIAAGAACGGGDGGSGPSPSSITGTWQLTKVLFVSQANPQQSVDLIALGGTGTLTFNSDNTFSYTVTVPPAAPGTTTGTWSLGGQVLTLVRDGFSGNLQFTVTLSGQTLKLAGGHVDFDVNNDGTDEPAILTLEGTK